MRSRNIGRLMSTYFGCRHVPSPGVVNFKGSRQVNKLSQSASTTEKQQNLTRNNKMITISVSKTENRQNLTLNNEMLTIRMVKKTYNVEDENQLSISEAEMSISKENRDTILRMKERALHSLPDLPLLNEVKPFLDTADKITKMESYVSDSPTSVVFVQEMLAPKERKSWARNHFESQTDVSQQGQDLYRRMRDYLLNGDDTLSVLSPHLEPYWESLKTVLADLTNVQCFEGYTAHPILGYVQRFDCIANYKGIPSIIIIKNITRNQHRIHKLGLVACAAAFNADPQWPVQVQNFVIIFPQSDGSPAFVHVFNNKNASILWEECLTRIEQFWKSPYSLLFVDTLMLLDEIMRPSSQHENNPNLCKSESNFEQSSGSTVNDFVLNHINIEDRSTTEERDQSFSESCAKSETKPDSEVNEKSEQRESGYQSKNQSEIPKDLLGTSKNESSSQNNNPDLETKEGALKSIWSFWKPK